MDLTPSANMTLHGSALNLLDVLATTDPEALPASVREAAARLEAAIRGPDWAALAATLDLDAGLGPAVDDVLDQYARLDHASWSADELMNEVSRLMDVLYRARKVDGPEWVVRRARDVAAALEAAADHGRLTEPLERLTRVDLTPGTVLCFPVPPRYTPSEQTALIRAVARLGERLSTHVGFQVQTLCVPEDAMPTIVAATQATIHPPRGIRRRVSVRGRSVIVVHTPDGWIVPDVLSLGLSLEDVSLARRLAEDGYGQLID